MGDLLGPSKDYNDDVSNNQYYLLFKCAAGELIPIN